jgi:GxxExxY protein
VFCRELSIRQIKFQRQIAVPIVYDGITIHEGLCLDVLVEDLVIGELEAVDEMNPVWQAQLLSYLRLTNKRLGLLINL